MSRIHNTGTYVYCGRFEVCLEGKKAKKVKAKRKKKEKKIGKAVCQIRIRKVSGFTNPDPS
jgi:hypothetical protein